LNWSDEYSLVNVSMLSSAHACVLQ